MKIDAIVDAIVKRIEKEESGDIGIGYDKGFIAGMKESLKLLTMLDDFPWKRLDNTDKLVLKERTVVYRACTCGGEYMETGNQFTDYPLESDGVINVRYEYRCDKCGNVITLSAYGYRKH